MEKTGALYLHDYGSVVIPIKHVSEFNLYAHVPILQCPSMTTNLVFWSFSDTKEICNVEQPESIDLTADDDDADDDKDTMQPISGIISTVPNFTPATEGCIFSIVNVSSLSTEVPGLLYEKCVADIQFGGTDNGVSYSSNAVTRIKGTINDANTYNQHVRTDNGESYHANADIQFGGTNIDVSYGANDDVSFEDDDDDEQTIDQPKETLRKSVVDSKSDQIYVSRADNTDEGNDEAGDPAAFMIPSIPINPLKYVQFNKEFYGRSKTRIVLKRHICELCGKRLLKKSDLERHVRVHTGEKPFMCSACRQRFSQKHSLDVHRRKMRH